ncbi:hypothetical protein K438DRAFT_1949731 [Mycena galopus ATCC 62051]|nr:hypothetical protein K438DRAFT_1949731 [Mycena galopus ATCC 62051]
MWSTVAAWMSTMANARSAGRGGAWMSAAAQMSAVQEIELLPNLRPLRNGDSVIGPGGFYYMGGVNNGDRLDAQQCAHLDEMLNNDEPQVENDDDPQIFACFSDEEFTGPDEVDEW